MSTKEISFTDWFFSEFEKIPQYEPIVLTQEEFKEVLNEMRELFNYSRIQKTTIPVWIFNIKDSRYLNNATIRVWRKNDKSYIGIVLESLANLSNDREFHYYNGCPLGFIKEIKQRFRVNNASKKFGI